MTEEQAKRRVFKMQPRPKVEKQRARGSRHWDVDDDHEAIVNMNWHKIVDKAIHHLEGLATAIIYDAVVHDHEISMLQSWLHAHREFRDCWPVSEISDLLDSILEDGIVTDEERRALFLALQKFACGPKVDGTPCPEMCDSEPRIEFPGRCFLITGKLRVGKRREVQERIRRAGGIVKTAMSGRVHYLVIGDLGTEAWAHSRHGRKIEEAMELRRDGADVSIVSEQDFVEALIAATSQINE